LIYQGDLTVRNLIKSIKTSPAWEEGRNAIVLVWDENDYSNAPNTNQVVLIVDTNYGVHGVKSANFYTHFSLLKSLEAGFGLPCLNHACDEAPRSCPTFSARAAARRNKSKKWRLVFRLATILRRRSRSVGAIVLMVRV